MKRLARKVTLAKWHGTDWASIDRIPADAISIDLKTSGNALSFWEADEGGVGDSAAILALLGTLQRVDKIDIAFIDGHSIEGVALTKSEGDTCITDLRNLHIDIAELDNQLLSSTATAIGREIYNQNTVRLTKHQVQQLLQKALDDNRLDWNSLPESVRSSLTPP